MLWQQERVQPLAKAQKKVTPDALLKRHAAAVSRRDKWKSLYQKCDEYAKPERNVWNNQAEGQEKIQDKIFDSTAIQATTSFANRIQSDMFPPFQKWMQLKPGALVPKDKKSAVEKELDDASEKFYAVNTSSNFDTVMNECLLELATGTMVMQVDEGEDDDEVIIHSSLPNAMVAIEEGANGKVSAVFFEQKIAARNILDTWGDAELTAALTKTITEKPDTEIEFISCCYKIQGSSNYCFEVIEKSTKTSIVNRIREDSPFIVARWSKISGEVWGRGVLTGALPDIKTLNKLVEMTLRYAALRIAGVWAVKNDGVLNTNNIVIAPGATIPVANPAGQNASMANLAPQGDIQLAELEREKLTMSIQKALFDTRLPPQTGGIRSATEIMERVKELAKDIGAPFGRLNTEFVVPYVQRVLNIMYRRGLIKSKVKVNGMFVKAQVISPLAMVQNISDVENVVRWLQILSSFGQETLYIAAKMEDVGSWIGEKLGIPTDLRRSDTERKDLQEKMAQAMMQQQQAKQGYSPAGQGIAQGHTIPVA